MTDDYTGVAGALTATHPGESAQLVGQSVLDLAAQNLSFPAIDADTLAASPSSTTSGMENGYWARDAHAGHARERLPGSAAGDGLDLLPDGGAELVRLRRHQQADLQRRALRGDRLLQSHRSQASWAAALTPDVIVDDMSSDCAIPRGRRHRMELGGWRVTFSTRRPPPARRPARPRTRRRWRPAPGSSSVPVPYSSDYQATTATAHLTASDGPHVATLDETQPGGRFYALGSYHFGGGPDCRS